MLGSLALIALGAVCRFRSRRAGAPKAPPGLELVPTTLTNPSTPGQLRGSALLAEAGVAGEVSRSDAMLAWAAPPAPEWRTNPLCAI